ncbi:hypothetical protein FYK55_04090 [Roseiconus nitratireducens]|uniref:Secreted protein n=1 Tax=Roseiconus nitratireducens TaxID=2605748 RepID=A0A5M6DF30_9BACT|nr:hypothetical protein [Roseiconus nitratireducens]KAA5546088.1 hypothetical protein FYK55_04090 [Roseiconus nitratireducens]
MSRRLRHLMVAATLITVVSGASVAQASHIRSTVNRRQHPGHCLFKRDDSHHRHATVIRVDDRNTNARVVRTVRVNG